TGGSSSIYYAGINLIVLGTAVFAPWRTHHLMGAFALIMGPFLYMTLFMEPNTDWGTTLPNLAFLFSTAFMCTVIHTLNHRLRSGEVLAKKDLEEEILNKEIIIAQKTKEGVELERLASQFSPQIVRAIKSGALQLSERKRQLI